MNSAPQEPQAEYAHILAQFYNPEAPKEKKLSLISKLKFINNIKYQHLVATLVFLIAITGVEAALLISRLSGGTPVRETTSVFITATPAYRVGNIVITPSPAYLNPFALATKEEENPFGAYENPFIEIANYELSAGLPYRNPFGQ